MCCVPLPEAWVSLFASERSLDQPPGGLLSKATAANAAAASSSRRTRRKEKTAGKNGRKKAAGRRAGCVARDSNSRDTSCCCHPLTVIEPRNHATQSCHAITHRQAERAGPSVVGGTSRVGWHPASDGAPRLLPAQSPALVPGGVIVSNSMNTVPPGSKPASCSC